MEANANLGGGEGERKIPWGKNMEIQARGKTGNLQGAES